MICSACENNAIYEPVFGTIKYVLLPNETKSTLP